MQQCLWQSSPTACCLIALSDLWRLLDTRNSAGKPYSVVCEKTRFLDWKDPVNHYMNIAFKLVAVFAVFAEVGFSLLSWRQWKTSLCNSLKYLSF